MAKIKQNTLTPEEMFCLDAFLISGDADMAFRLSRKRPKKEEPPTFHRQALRWLRDEQVQKYLEERKAVIFHRSKDAETIGKFRDKDTILSALEAELPTLKGKDRLDCLMRIADLQQMKKEETKNDEERVHYYLPLPICKDCPNRKKLGKNEWEATEKKGENEM